MDGEMVALDSEGRQNFRGLRVGRGNLHYAAFDALWIEGKDLRPLLLTRRKQLLMRIIPATTTVLSQVFSIAERGRDLFAASERLDLEGNVAKRKVDPYQPETVWYKIKSRIYSQGEGRWSCSISRADYAETLLTCVVPTRTSILTTPRQRHTRRKPGPQSHGSSPPPRRRTVTPA